MTTNHNNIYNILGKLNAIQPAEQPSQKESILKQLNESAAPQSLTARLNAAYQESKQLNEYFEFDTKPSKDRGPRDTGTDELARREKTLGKGGLGKGKPFGKEYKEKGSAYGIAGPKGKLPEGITDEDVLQPKGKDMPDWVRHPEDPKSKVPAYKRKAADPGRMGAASAADEKNKAAGAKVWRSGRPTDMEEGAVEEGFPTVADARARSEKERGTGKFDKKQTSTGTVYSRKSDTFDSGDDDSGSEGKAAKKEKKAKKPERVTSKAWKHKGGRKTNENINLETVVEETLSEMDNLLLSEKAVSQQQQKYFGMVHALQTGKKVPGASASLKKTAKSIGKKDAKDFASTKHKGLPKKVTESIALECDDPALQIVLHRYGKEVGDFVNQGMLDPDLYHALHDHYYDEMPASIKRGAGTEDWVSEQFRNALGGGIGAEPVGLEVDLDLGPAEPIEIDTGVHHDRYEHGDDLEDLAKLAGIAGGSECNHTMEGEYCPEHGLAECGSMMYEGKKVDQNGDGKNDFKDVQIARMKASGMSGKAAQEKVDEADVDQNGDGKNDFKDVQIARMKASGMSGKEAKEKVDEADATLAQMRKIAGLPEVVAEEFANEPDEQYIDQDVINDQGNDLNKKKVQDPQTANKAANPIHDRLARMYEKLAK